MKTTKNYTIHRAGWRGTADYGWLKTSYSFSFARYFNPDRIHFGALRVLNDDQIAPGKGFDLHPHDNMEIITIPLKGSLLHKDTLGHQQIITSEEVQVMSAGNGLFHAEYNASNTDELSLFQIWIFPNEKNVEPVYHQMKFNAADAHNQWQKIVAPLGDQEVLTIRQNAWIYRANMDKGTTLHYSKNPESMGCYLMVVEGSLEFDGIQLNRRDALEISQVKDFKVNAVTNCSVINIEIPEFNQNNY